MENLTKELLNIRDAWPQLMAEVCLVSLTWKESLKKKMLHDEILSETNAYNDKQQLKNLSEEM
jgi:hypothetical protein